jgi:delta8-fatty-acid desaturase
MCNETVTEKEKRLDKGNREFTIEDVAQHIKNDDAWIIVDGAVYDISKFLRTEIHPGGDIIFTQAGRDATDIFYAYHPNYVFKRKLPKYRLGALKDPPEPPQMVKEFRAMRKKLETDGLYDVQWYHYLYWAWHVVYPGLMLAAAIYIFRRGFESRLVNTFAGVLVGLAQHQWAFIGHDGSHGAISGKWGPDFALSILCGTLGFGCSSSWWKYTHNNHHVVTNEYDRDTDITHLPFYAVSKHMLLSDSKGTPMGNFEAKFARAMVSIQAFTFFPVMLLIARFSLLINMLLMCFVTNKVPTMQWQSFHFPLVWKNADRAAILGHLAWVYVVFAHVVPEGHRAAAFLAHWVVVSSLHIQLVGNHWDRPNKFSKDETDNWFVKQVVTGRNYESGWLFNWLHGGLEFQIEHHIFPRLPKYSLEICKDEYVRPFCKKWGIPYSTGSFLGATFDTWKRLADVGASAMDEKYE